MTFLRPLGPEITFHGVQIEEFCAPCQGVIRDPVSMGTAESSLCEGCVAKIHRQEASDDKPAPEEIEAVAWMETQEDALTLALGGLVKQRHLLIRSTRNTENYRCAAYLRRLYPRRLIRAMIEAELRAEAYHQKKETRDLFPDLPGAVTTVEEAFLSNLRQLGYDATREKWGD